jgi:chemotaxis signal transduction protein
MSAAASSTWLLPSAALSRAALPAPLSNAKAQSAGAVRFGYRIGSLHLLIGKGVLSELLANSETYPIPNVPSALRGYVNRQGALVPVWDLGQLLGQSADTQDESDGPARESILVLGRGELRIGVLIDGLPQSLKHTERVARLPQLPNELSPYVKDALYAEQSVWFEFEHEEFFRAQTAKAAA